MGEIIMEYVAPDYLFEPFINLLIVRKKKGFNHFSLYKLKSIIHQISLDDVANQSL